MQDCIINFSQRKIQKNYRSITGHFPSIKNNTSIGFESKLEKAHFLSLEFDNEVISYQEQPQIEICINGNDKIYSADCYIKRSILTGIIKNFTFFSGLLQRQDLMIFFRICIIIFITCRIDK